MRNKSFFAFFVFLPSVLSYNPLINEDFQDTVKQLNATDASDMSIIIINEDYWEKSIGQNEDTTLDFTGLTSKYGYKAETHTVTTDDNYILTLFRIKKGKKCSDDMKNSPVIMMHGLCDSSDTFIVSGPDAALGYLVADACYDVWIANHRGNRYSRGHVNYTADNSEEYWNFTYDQHGTYDLKAIVDYVLDATNKEKVSYIGHSQGTTDFYVLTSTLPEYNEKFNIAISLAPIAWMHHLKSPLLKLLASATPQIKVALDILRIRELFRREDASDKFLEVLCQFLPGKLCGIAITVLGSGGDPETIGSETLKTVFRHYPCATSSINFVHFGQGVNINKFRRYDYGFDRNLEVYGSEEPPEYDVTKITAPVALIASRGDLLSAIEDVATLRAGLSNVVHYSEMDEFWGHSHYTWGQTVPTQLAPTVFKLLDTYGS